MNNHNISGWPLTPITAFYDRQPIGPIRMFNVQRLAHEPWRCSPRVRLGSRYCAVLTLLPQYKYIYLQRSSAPFY